MRKSIPGCVVLLASTSIAWAQQSTVEDFSPRIENPAYVTKAPVIAIDEAHDNFHTISGSYAPFARLARADGYQVKALPTKISAGALTGIDVLVISDARMAQPGTSSFSTDECNALNAWVAGGGSLFLIADHAPFASASAPLAAVFGVEMGGGFVTVLDARRVTSQIPYRGVALGSHPIVHGRNSGEAVRRVTSFTGQSLGAPPATTPILILPKEALEVGSSDDVSSLRRGAHVPAKQVGGRSQLLAMRFGKGRIVVAGEAAMFTAQRIKAPNGQTLELGLRSDDDLQLALNILHWLSKLIG